MEHRLRQRGRGHGLVAQMHGHHIAVGRGFRLDPQLSSARNNQQSLARRPRARCAARMSVSMQLFQHDLARDGLRHLDHGREVEVFDRRCDRARRTGRWLFRL